MNASECALHVRIGPEVPEGIESPDVYFLPGYGRAATVADVGTWVLVEGFSGAWQMPLIIRTVGNGQSDAISPYGYSGVYASPSLSTSQIQEAWSATVDSLRAMGVISVLLRHSPLVPQAPDFEGQSSILSGHPTRVLELVDSDSAWSEMEGRCRTSIRKAIKNGYTAEVRPTVDADLAPGGDFRRLYDLTMRRRSASSSFFFGDRYYSELVDGLGPDLFVGEARDSQGSVVSSALFMRHSQRLHYHLSGSSVDDARMGSNNLMLWTATQFAISEGLAQFHLGGGVGARDQLFQFKRSFGGRELEYRVSGLVLDPDLYEFHTRKRAISCDTTPAELLASNFFPAYRGGAIHA